MSATAYVSNDAADYAALAPDGATATGDFTFFRWLNDTKTVDHDRVQTMQREGGDGLDLGVVWVEHHTGKGAIAGYGRPEMLTRLLGWALGQGTITGASSMPHTHDLWPVPQARLLQFEAAAPQQTIIEKLVQAKVQEVSLTAEHGKPLRVVAQIVGGDSPQQIAPGSARTVSYETNDPFFFNQGSYNVAVQGSSQADDDITKWTVTFTRTQDESVFGVGYGRKAITDQSRQVAVDFSRKYESATAHNAILYNTGSLVAPQVATGSFDVYMSNGLAGTNLRDLRLRLPLVIWETVTRNAFEVDGNTVYEDFTGAAMKARGGTHLITVQINSALATIVASGIS